jgi:hypothetical protein
VDSNNSLYFTPKKYFLFKNSLFLYIYIYIYIYI